MFFIVLGFPVPVHEASLRHADHLFGRHAHAPGAIVFLVFLLVYIVVFGVPWWLKTRRARMADRLDVSSRSAELWSRHNESSNSVELKKLDQHVVSDQTIDAAFAASKKQGKKSPSSSDKKKPKKSSKKVVDPSEGESKKTRGTSKSKSSSRKSSKNGSKKK